MIIIKILSIFLFSFKTLAMVSLSFSDVMKELEVHEKVVTMEQKALATIEIGVKKAAWGDPSLKMAAVQFTFIFNGL